MNDATIREVTSTSARIGWTAEGEDPYRVYLASEPPREPGSLPAGARFHSEVAARAGQAQLGPLAPAVDVFITLEAGNRRKTLHARTLGGPGAKLDTAFRAVNAVGPRTLALTFTATATWDPGRRVLTGAEPALFSDHGWALSRSSGQPLPILSVHRHSFPVSQPIPTLGFGRADGSRPEWNRVEIDHRLFLDLAEPLGAPEVLSLARRAGGGRLVALLPWSDRYLEALSVQLNQVGYSPGARRRYAYVSMWMGDGGPLALESFPKTAEILIEPLDPLAPRTVARSGLAVDSRRAVDAQAGCPVAQVDLSSVPALEGARYRLRLPGVGVSFPTAVSWEAVFKAYYVVARGLFYNRRGRTHTPRTSDFPPRPADHVGVFRQDGPRPPNDFFPEGTPRANPMRVVGEHHDAGDFDVRPSHPVVAMNLLRAYELGPRRFVDGQLDLPETGNGLPDLLDEALWSLSFWVALQGPSGGIRAGVESWRHPNGYYYADEDPLPYWTFPEDPDTSARVAASLAHAARLLRPIQSERAEELARRAVRAYTFARRGRASAAAIAHAAGELFLLLRNDALRREFEATVDGPFFRNDGWTRFQNVPARDLGYPEWIEPGQAHVEAFLAYAQAVGPGEPRVDAYRRMLTDVVAGQRRQLDRDHAHRSIHGTNWGWGYGAHPARYLPHALALLQLSTDAAERAEVYDLLALAADWTLGANPAGMVWVTGLGSRSPQDALHLDSLSYKAQGNGQLPGIPVYGPVQDRPGPEYYQPALAAFHPAFEQHPRALAYGDTRAFVVCSEFSVWELQAPLTLHLAALLNEVPMRARDLGFQPTAAGGTTHRSPLPPHRVGPPTVLRGASPLAGEPLHRLRGVGPYWADRVGRTGVATIADIAAATPGPNVLAGHVEVAREVLRLADELEVPPDLAGLRVREILAMPLSEDERITRFQVALQELKERLRGRWFSRRRASSLVR